MACEFECQHAMPPKRAGAGWTHVQVRRAPFLLAILRSHILSARQFGFDGNEMRRDMRSLGMYIVEDGRV